MYWAYYTLLRGDEEIEVDVEYSLTRSFPARLYGPPEDCCPAEGGEIDELTVYRNDERFFVTRAERRQIEAHIYDNHIDD